MTKDEALRLALEALKENRAWLETDAPTEVWEKNNEAITASKAALLSRSNGEAKDEPVAWWIPKHKAPDMVSKVRWSDECEPLYTTPPQRKPLTLEQLSEHWKVAKVFDMTYEEIYIADYVLIARDVEALHGIKGEA